MGTFDPCTEAEATWQEKHDQVKATMAEIEEKQQELVDLSARLFAETAQANGAYQAWLGCVNNNKP